MGEPEDGDVKNLFTSNKSRLMVEGKKVHLMKDKSFRARIARGVLMFSALLLLVPAAFAAITIDNNSTAPIREKTGQTAGSEVILHTDPARQTIIEASPEGTGSATIAASMDTDAPANFSHFSMDTAGATTTTKMINLGMGIVYVGVSITTGPWTTRVYNK